MHNVYIRVESSFDMVLHSYFLSVWLVTVVNSHATINLVCLRNMYLHAIKQRWLKSLGWQNSSISIALYMCTMY